MKKSLFNTDRRIRLGIWGLGRGQNFIASARALNIDVVAGCDINASMRDAFARNCPDSVGGRSIRYGLANAPLDKILDTEKTVSELDAWLTETLRQH